MADSSAKKGAEKNESTAKPAEIFFTCKFCGETKPLSELVVIRHFYPQLTSCKTCSRGVVNHEESK